MNKATLTVRLNTAEWHVAKGRDAVARQRYIVAGLNRAKLDSTTATALLASMEETLALFISGRDKLAAELVAMQS